MKEFSQVVSKEFSTGLRKYHKSRRGTTQFYELINFKPTKYGLTPYEPVLFPITDAVYNGNSLDDETFPFPQLFVGKYNAFILGRERIFYVNTNDWSILYELTLYDAENTGSTKAITPGGSWEFIDFWDTWFFTNGVCTIFASSIDVMMGNAFKVYVHDGVPVACGADHKGRVIFGGFDYNNFWDSTWQSFFQSWIDSDANNVTDVEGLSMVRDVGPDSDVLMPVKENWIWWSSIGGGDALMFFLPDPVINKSPMNFTTQPEDPIIYGLSKPFIGDLLKKNEQGFAPMPFKGKVTAIRPLGDYVIVYSEEGVAAIRPVASPAPTFSIRNLELGGLSSRGAIAGDDNHHVYLDKSGVLVRIPANLDVKPLGYREYLYNLLGNDTIISHAKNMQNVDAFGEFYISDGSRNFMLNEEGLCEHKQKVTSAFYFQGATIGLGSKMDSGTDIEGYVGIDAEDFGFAGLKTVEAVQVMGRETLWSPDDATQLQVALEYRYKVGDDQSWQSTSFRIINDEGMVYFPVTALDFRLRIKITDYEKLDIDYARFYVKHGDKRFTRSIPINQAFA